jgi:hypothetical protein
MMLRERRSPTLLIMQDDAIDIEGNMIASGKIKQKIDQVDKDKNKIKEEVSTSDPNRDSQDAKIEEMSRLIRNCQINCLYLKLRVIMQINLLGREVPRNPNQFRRPFNPQILRRERRNEEQPIQPPIINNNDNNLIEDMVDEEYVDFQEEIHLLQDDNDAIHLTQNDYENSLNPKRQFQK